MINLLSIFNPLFWISFFALLAWYFYLKARNKERMALIEKGADVSEFYTKSDLKFRFPWLKLGIIFTGIGIGIGIAYFLYFASEQRDLNIDGRTIILISILIFGGISMIIAYFVDKPREKK